MMTALLHTTEIAAEERAWLVRHCQTLCGDAAAAEDLAQETLLAAWQGAERRPSDVAPRAWLAGIARNMMRRWARRRGAEQRRFTTLDADDPQMADDDPLIAALERQELAGALGDALAQLPPATRVALVAHYLDEQPQAEIATRLGLSEGAVAVRLHRGRQALQRILAPAVADRLPGMGERIGWESTTMWCFLCGRHRLEGQFDAAHQNLRLRCPTCGVCMDHGVAVRGAKTYGAAVNRITRWLADYYLPATERGTVVCFACGARVPVRVADDPTDPYQAPMLVADCPCRVTSTCGMSYMALLTEAGQAFMRAHPRLRLDAHTVVETEAGPTGILTFASVTTADRFVARYQRSTLRPLP